MNEFNEEEVKLKINRFLNCVICFFVGLFVGTLGTTRYYNQNTPVEKNTKIDSLVQVNDSIKLKVEKLDSIKDAKVIEVSSLDNDSTLKLFYKLVSE